MKKRLLNFWNLLKSTYKKWNEKDPFRQSAVIAYYAIFSLPGILVVLIAIADIFLDREAISGRLYNQVQATMGSETADQVEGMILNASDTGKSIWAAIIGIATIILGATGVFGQLQKSLNIIWEVESKPEKGFWPLIRVRVFSFGLIVSIGFLLLISLVLTSVLTAMSDWVQDRWPDYIMVLFQILNFVVSFGVVMLLFSLMFKILPDAKIKWRHVWQGSVLTTLLFILGKTGLGFYFGKSNPGEDYGAAGSIILILLWVSYSSMIVFFGAEFTRSVADRETNGHGVAPSPQAVKVPGRGRGKDAEA